MAVIDQYFKYLVEAGGSDLHLSEGQPPKIRVNGTISAISDENLEGQSFKNLLAEICDSQAFQKYLEEGDLDFAYEMDETSRFRCNYFRQQHGLGAVFRLIPTKIATLEELGVPTVVKEFAHMRSGLVLVTGPTGSGKSTTLAAIIDYINSNQARHIITVEEPIEFVHPNKKSIVTQVHGSRVAAFSSWNGLGIHDGKACVMSDARRGGWTWGRLENGILAAAPEVLPAEQARARMAECLENGVPVYSTETAETLAAREMTGGVPVYPHAEALGVAWQSLAAGRREELLEGPAEPLYVRAPHITCAKRPAWAVKA